MKKRDCISGIFLFFLGLFISLTCLRYPLGSLSTPGGGLFPLFASIILMGLSGFIILNTFMAEDKGDASKVHFFEEKDSPKRIFFGLSALLAFRFMFPIIGFSVTTFAFTLFLVKSIGGYSWKLSMIISVVTALVCYIVFQVWFKIPMPRGILGN